MDFHSKKIIGYAYDTSVTADLALKVVYNKCLNVKNIVNIILQSVLDTQYTNHIFEDYLKSKGIIHFYNRKGNLYHNACIESFYSDL